MTVHPVVLRRWEAAPLATAAVLFAMLAATRIAGAFAETLMVVSIALTPLVLAAVPRAQWRAVGLTLPPRGSWLWPVVLIVAAYAVVTIACTVALGSGEDNWIHAIPQLFLEFSPQRPWVAYVFMALSLGILVPAIEELCYRGVLHHAVDRRFGPQAAAVITAAAWSAVHLGDYGLHPFDANVVAGMLPSVFVMGLALGACRVATRSVLPCMVAQGTANLLLAAWAVTM